MSSCYLSSLLLNRTVCKVYHAQLWGHFQVYLEKSLAHHNVTAFKNNLALVIERKEKFAIFTDL